MKIAELKNGTSKVNLTAKVVEKEETREVNTKFGKTTVANATLEDDSGTIVLVLWGDETQKVSKDDTVRIENGYVKEWNGSLQLSAGKFGKISTV